MEDNYNYSYEPLNSLAREAHKIAVDHGWWDIPPSFGEVVALCHSELSEALQSYRNNEPSVFHDVKDDGSTALEGYAVEMVDTLIRILDFCGAIGLDVDSIMAQKMEYNRSRPYRHGGKKL